MHEIVINTFRDGLIDAGNLLKIQSIFIANRMPHIRNYLSKAGIKHSFCYFKPSDFVMDTLMMKSMSSGSLEDGIEELIKSDKYEYKTNPFNIFYRFILMIEDPSIEFIKDMDNLYGVKRDTINENSRPMISFLPTADIKRIDDVIRLIHKHF